MFNVRLLITVKYPYSQIPELTSLEYVKKKLKRSLKMVNN